MNTYDHSPAPPGRSMDRSAKTATGALDRTIIGAGARFGAEGV